MKGVSKSERGPTTDLAEWFKFASDDLTALGYADTGGRLVRLKDEPRLQWLCYDSEGRPDSIQKAKLICQEDTEGRSIEVKIQGHNEQGSRAVTRIRLSYNRMGIFRPNGSFIRESFADPEAAGEFATRFAVEARTETEEENGADIGPARFDEEDEAFIYRLVSNLTT